MLTLTPPRDPLAAVTHPDPYGYYANLVARTPFYRDEQLRLWVAAGAAAVTAVLSSDLGHVRPPEERVPQALQGSPAGMIFGHLVRMNDGSTHEHARRAVALTLTSIQPDALAPQSRTWARQLARERDVLSDPSQITTFACDVSVYTLATLLGVPRDQLPQVAAWMGDFARGFAANSSDEQVTHGISAADRLLDLFRSLLAEGTSDGLLMRLAHDAKQAGVEDTDSIVANGIGLMSQAYDATSGLVGNTLLALATRPDVRAQVMAEPDLLPQVIAETLRYDPPVHNTRRFVVRDGSIAGHEMHAGDVILAVFAAANRDPAANEHPERFDLLRTERQSYTFGLGVHGCMGTMLATTIAAAGVEALMDAEWLSEQLATTVSYRPSTNLRIPLWTTTANAAYDERNGLTR